MVNKQKTKKINKLKPRTVLKRSKLSKKKYSLKRPRKNLLKTYTKNKSKSKTNTKTKHVLGGGSLYYDEYGFHIMENIDLDLDKILNNKKIFRMFQNRYFNNFNLKRNKQLKFINENKDIGINSLLKEVFNIMNIPPTISNLMAMNLVKTRVNRGRLRGMTESLSQNKYVRPYYPSPDGIFSKPKDRCTVLYFYKIPNENTLNLELIFGVQKKKKSLFPLNKKILSRKKIKTTSSVEIKEKMAILVKYDTYYKLKMNKVTLKEPLIILEINLRCGKEVFDVTLNN